MLTTAVETGRTEPYQIIAREAGAPRASKPTVGKEDRRYYDLRWFPTPDQGQTWVQVRFEQIKAIEAQKTEARRGKTRQVQQQAVPGPHASLRQAFPDLIPAKPYCADILDDGLFRSRSAALRRRHVQLNGPSSFTWMPHDIDRPGAFYAHDDANVPPPNVIMVNPENGHAHSAYLLANPVARHSASRVGPLRFYGAVERGIARRLGADRRYTGLIAKNPLHADWKVEWRREQPYTLPELADWLFDSDMAPDLSVQTTLGVGRNVTVFDELRVFAYREVLRFKRDTAGIAGLTTFQARLEAVALGINMQFPEALKLTEVRAIAKSVSRWTWARFTPENFSQKQRHRAQTRTRRHLGIVEMIKNGRA
jgi:replicase family protein